MLLIFTVYFINSFEIQKPFTLQPQSIHRHGKATRLF